MISETYENDSIYDDILDDNDFLKKSPLDEGTADTLRLKKEDTCLELKTEVAINDSVFDQANVQECLRVIRI